MNYNNKAIYYVPIVYILILMYRMSWLPFAGMIDNRESIIFLFFFICLVVISFDFDRLARQKKKIPIFKSILFIILISLSLISIFLFNSHEVLKLTNIINLFNLLFSIILFCKIFPQFLVKNPKYFEKLIKLISNFGLITALFGVLLLISGYKPNQMAVYLISFIRHPNGVSIILTLSIISTLYYYVWKKDAMPTFIKYYYLFSFFLQFIAELLTQSRTGILGVIVAITVFLGIHYRKKLVLLIPIIVAGINLFVLGYIMQKGASSFISRLRLWFVAYYLIDKDPSKLLWGYGFTESNEIFKRNAMIFTETVEHPHNAYISILLMFGVYFLIAFIIFMIVLLSTSILRLVRANGSNERLFYNFIISIFVSLLFQGIFESPLVLFWYFLMPIFLIILGILYKIYIKEPELSRFYE